MGYSPWGHKESDTTELLTHTHTHTHPSFAAFSEPNRKEMNILFHNGELWFEPEFKEKKCITEDIRLECT